MSIRSDRKNLKAWEATWFSGEDVRVSLVCFSSCKLINFVYSHAIASHY